MSVQLSPLVMQRFYDNNNNPLVGGQLFTYQAGTTTPQATYTDSTGSTSNTNPVILNARGEAPVWLAPTQSYKLVLCDAAGNTIWTVDNITAPAPVAVGNMTDEKGAGGTVGFAAGVDFIVGTTTSLTLSTNYFSASNLWVAFDGTEQGGDSYTLSGKTLTFNAPIPIGVSKVYVKGGSSLSIGTPGSGSITDASVATGTKLYNRITDIIDAKDWGALGNGTHDDTTSLQNALNFLASIGGGELYVPAGTYLTGALTMYPNIRIRGTGDATQFIPNAANIVVFTLSTATVAPPANSSYQDFQINCGSLAGVTGILSVYYGSIRYSNLTFTGCNVTISIDRGRVFFLENIISQGSPSRAHSAGVLKIFSSTDSEYVTDIKVSKYYLLNIGNGTTVQGIYVRRAVGAMFTEVSCNDMNTGNASPGIFITFENDCQGCKVAQAIAGACSYMVLMQIGSGVNIAPSFIELSDCDWDQTYTAAVLINAGNYITINGGMYTSSGVNLSGTGILLQSGTHIVINGVQFNGWSSGTGILFGTTDSVTVIGCFFENCNQGIGVPANTITRTLISNNQADASTPNFIGGTWTGVTNRAINNLGWNPQLYVAVPSMPATGVTISNTNAVDVDVYVSAGVITGVNKNGIVTGIAGPGVVNLAPGDTIGLNYTSTPNWAWIGRK